MLKLLVSLIIIELFIQSELLTSAVINSVHEDCQIYSYKPFSVRNNILSNISNKTIISDLSIIGTHESMSYRTSDLKIQTQDLSITQQLMYGVRFLDLSVRYSNSQSFEIYSRSVDLNCTLNNVLRVVAVFLLDNPQEFVIINLKIDRTVDHDDDDDDDDDDANPLNSYLRDNYEESCKPFDNLDPRVIRNWELKSTVASVRGKILLSTTDPVLASCMLDIDEECLLSNNVLLRLFGNGFNYYPIINYKWNKYVSISKEEKFNKYQCYVYDLSVYDNYSLFSLGFTKYGGYYNYSGQCIEPINYKLVHRYTDNRNASLTIILVDYVVSEIIDKVNSYNEKVDVV